MYNSYLHSVQYNDGGSFSLTAALQTRHDKFPSPNQCPTQLLWKLCPHRKTTASWPVSSGAKHTGHQDISVLLTGDTVTVSTSNSDRFTWEAISPPAKRRALLTLQNSPGHRNSPESFSSDDRKFSNLDRKFSPGLTMIPSRRASIKTPVLVFCIKARQIESCLQILRTTYDSWLDHPARYRIGRSRTWTQCRAI